MNIITLSNGKKVANFSSPHPFTFEDGNVLPAVSNEEAERLQVTFIETPIGYNGDIALDFKLSEDILDAVNYWLLQYKMKLVDIVFCPLPMIKCFKQEELIDTPFRAIRIEDRIKKLISIHKQTL